MLRQPKYFQIFVFDYISVNIHPTIAIFDPPIDNKENVKNTNFQKILILKVNARVKLTWNVDTADCLTNGIPGEVKTFHRNADGKVQYIMVLFDQPHQGAELRERHPGLAARYPGCTPVEKILVDYWLGKNKKAVARQAKVFQYPLW